MPGQSTIECPPFVELNRRFLKLPNDAQSEETALASYTALFLGRDNSYGWDDLLKQCRVIVLGEAGSGKTREFRERAKLLATRGDYAFLIRLDQLVHRDLFDVLGDEDRRRFQSWKNSIASAYFFLDSVDEAKFRKVSEFYSGLERFANALGPQFLAHAKIFLSSRITEWKPASDALEFRRVFPVAPRLVPGGGAGESKVAKEDDIDPLVVQILPLDRSQVESLARAKSFQNTPEFIQALDRSFAWEFARRPLDVSELIAFWKTKKRIASLTELIEFDVATKLRSRDTRDDHPLSEAEALTGAMWLAAASLFCRKFLFLVTDDRSVDADALSPAACLPCTWRDYQTRALLNRALFDSAAYGRIRLHHRRVAEFLAAKWVTQRLDHGCPLPELERLLVENVRGRRVFRPAMRPIAAWLCTGSSRGNQLVRELVSEVDPEIHLNFGDPAALSLEYRRRVLNALAGRSKERRRMWLRTSHDSLARFADPALESDIRALILDRSLATDLRIEMLEIVRHGNLAGCLDAVVAIVAAQEECDELKQHAALAIGAIGNSETSASLARVVSQMSSVPRRLSGAAIEALYPNHLSPSGLVSLLSKSEGVCESSWDFPYQVKSHIQHVVSPETAADLLKELLGLIRRKPHTEHGGAIVPVSSQFYWVGRLVPAVFGKLFERSNLARPEVEVAAEALQLLGLVHKYYYRDLATEEMQELNGLSRKQPRVRQEYLWRMAVGYRDGCDQEPVRALDLFDRWEVLRLEPADFHWLVKDARERSDLNDRLLALQLAIEAWDLAGRPFVLRWGLRTTARQDKALWEIYRKSAVAGVFMPVRRFWYRRIRYKYGEKWWWMDQYRNLSLKWRWVRGQINLNRKLKVIASGKPVSWLLELSREADEQRGMHWTPGSWQGLERKRGKRIARAAKHGCIAFWRGCTPPLPHEKPEPNETSSGLIVGLTGIQAEFDEDPLTADRLSEAEASLAARYAMDELNGFPPWLELIAAKHPSAVKRVLEQCVDGEWLFQAGRQGTNGVMMRLSWRGGMLATIASPKVLDLLETGDPANESILRSALAILTSAENPPVERLTEMAARRVITSSDVARKALWLSVWMHADAETAVEYLKSGLAGDPNADQIVVGLCSALSGEEMLRGPALKRPSYLQAPCLRRIIPLVYSHVRLSDDIDRTDGAAYTPTVRDNAQHFRGLLLDALAKNESPAASTYLREIAEEGAMVQVRDWVLKRLDERLERQADFAPWSPSDLRAFAEEHEVDPKSDRELFAIAHKRLLELKFDVESSNNSLRDEVRDAQEYHLRRWLARKLQERCRNRYNVPQEPEIDLKQRPDLHILRPGLPPVPVEAKFADLGWSMAALCERLENQLVGQYLRDYRTDYGLYVVGTLGRQRHWKHPSDGRRLTFSGAIAFLSERANELVRINPRIGNLAVVGIDFSEPEH